MSRENTEQGSTQAVGEDGAGIGPLRAAPEPEPIEDPYGWIEFTVDTTKPPLRLTVGVRYGDDDPGTDIVLTPNGWVLKHPYAMQRESTEEERAAVGWTW